MNKIRFSFAAAAFALLVGCSGTMPVQAGGEIAKNSGTKVYSSVTTTNFLGFNPMDLATAEGVVAELQSKCNGGHVTGVTSLVKRTWLLIVVNETLEVSGYCAD
jgi:hypothetical protein